MFGFWVAFWLATVLPLGGLILRHQECVAGAVRLN
jgi:hypothetical protein